MDVTPTTRGALPGARLMLSARPKAVLLDADTTITVFAYEGIMMI